MVKLHDYQVECIEKINDHFKKHDKQIVQMPTGSGKTFIFLNFLKKYAKTGIILCPSLELQEQIHEWGAYFLGENNIEKGWKKINCPFHVLTLASLNYESTMQKVLKNKFDFVVMDEAHHGCSETIIKFLDRLKNHKFKLLGLTATPERLDKKNLLDIFGTLTYSKNILDMIEMKQICDVEAYKIKTKVDLKSRGNNHDFGQIELKSLDQEKRNLILLNTFENECKDKKTLIFCLNVEHAMKISNALKDKGYASEYIHGKMDFQERKRILERFQTGVTQILTNCQLLTEGFDEPSIEALILSRPTRSKSLYCQMIGRGLRKFQGKDRCLLYELADNNHKICTFNVLGGIDPSMEYDYPEGLRLSRLKKTLENVDWENLVIEKCEHEIFDLNQKEKDHFGFPCLESQRIKLKEIGIPECIINEIYFLEAEFLIFKQRLRVKYGFI